MGGACTKGHTVFPRKNQSSVDLQQPSQPPSPFGKASNNAVVSYAASEPDVEDEDGTGEGKKRRVQGDGNPSPGICARGRNVPHNPLARTPAGQSSDNLIPGTLAHQPTASLPPTGTLTTGPNQAPPAPKPQRTSGTQTDDEWLDWLAVSALEARTPTMPASWRKGGSIGSGSFGTVFLALNNDTGELLAVKEVTLGGVSKDQEAVEQLEHEVAVLSSLRHPNIVTYVGTVREGDTLLIFLEYVPGGSIASLLTRFGPLAEPAIRCFTRQLLDGLAYLHAQRTVHRDIKGANLLVETSGHVKLADFGMAKQMVEAASFTQSFKGSAFWMAPEVIRQQGYGVAADIWSLGCTVLEMATGMPPWAQCTTQVQAIFKIASSGELPTIPQSLSPQASEFILLCLQRDPARRPSAEALLQHPWILQDVEKPSPHRQGNSPSPSAWRQASHAYSTPPRPSMGTVAHRGNPSPHQAGYLLANASGALSRPPATHPLPPGGISQGGAVSGQGVTNHVLSESEMSDALAAMVLGPNMKRTGAGRRGGSSGEAGGLGPETGAAGHAADASVSASQVGEIDFTAKPSTFKVQGLLTLPPLKVLSGGDLPGMQLHQQAMLPPTASTQTGTH